MYPYYALVTYWYHSTGTIIMAASFLHAATTRSTDTNPPKPTTNTNPPKPGPSSSICEVSIDNIQSYAQGSLSLVEKDLIAHCDSAIMGVALSVCAQHGVADAFYLRRELVNLKKIVLHTFIDTIAQEKELRQLCCFFYGDHHFARLGAEDSESAATERAFTHSARYDAVCVALARCRAARSALNDARDYLKGLCSLPRHPDVAWQERLQALPAIEGMAVSKLLASGSAQVAPVAPMTTPVGDCVQGSASSHMLSALLQSAASAGLSANTVGLLECVLIARGAAKALGLREGAKSYLAAINAATAGLQQAATVDAADASAEAATRAAVQAAAEANACDADAVADALRPVLHAERRRLECGAAAEVTAHLSVWIETLLHRDATATRLFDASDRCGPAPHASSFAPTGFELGAHLRINGEVIRLYGPVMRAEIAAAAATEGWPPAAGSLRGCMHGTQTCSGCKRGFSPLWVARGVCCECEAVRRADGVCPFRGACGARSFCIHARRCLVCEEYSCESAGCRLVRGDGEAVAHLVARLASCSLRLLLVDFDRTLCSTRNGADPLKGAQSMDAELLSAASTAGIRTHVITRNPNKASIERFIAARGLEDAPVHCVGGGGRAAKAAVVCELVRAQMASEAGCGSKVASSAAGAGVGSPSSSIVALFVDDDAAEHLAVGEAAAELDLPVLRMLFTRA